MTGPGLLLFKSRERERYPKLQAHKASLPLYDIIFLLSAAALWSTVLQRERDREREREMLNDKPTILRALLPFVLCLHGPVLEPSQLLYTLSCPSHLQSYF